MEEDKARLEDVEGGSEVSRGVPSMLVRPRGVQNRLELGNGKNAAGRQFTKEKKVRGCRIL